MVAVLLVPVIDFSGKGFRVFGQTQKLYRLLLGSAPMLGNIGGDAQGVPYIKKDVLNGKTPHSYASSL
ncbi:MAG: hypothetical protein ACOX0K_02245 [Oscillospiraceae bacterium]